MPLPLLYYGDQSHVLLDLHDGDFQLLGNAYEVNKEDNSDDDSDKPEGNASLKKTISYLSEIIKLPHMRSFPCKKCL